MVASFDSELANLRRSVWPCPSLDRDGLEALRLVNNFGSDSYRFSMADERSAARLYGERATIQANAAGALTCHRRQQAVLEPPPSPAKQALTRYVVQSCIAAAPGRSLDPVLLANCWDILAPGVASARKQIIALTVSRKPVVDRHLTLDRDLQAGAPILQKIAAGVHVMCDEDYDEDC